MVLSPLGLRQVWDQVWNLFDKGGSFAISVIHTHHWYHHVLPPRAPFDDGAVDLIVHRQPSPPTQILLMLGHLRRVWRVREV